MSKDNTTNINVKECDNNNNLNKCLNKNLKENLNDNQEKEISKSIINNNHNIDNEHYLTKEFNNLNINKNFISNDNESNDDKELKESIYYKNEDLLNIDYKNKLIDFKEYTNQEIINLYKSKNKNNNFITRDWSNKIKSCESSKK